jgi:acetyl-CoA carboxylase biotin carboxyl carrier protein
MNNTEDNKTKEITDYCTKDLPVKCEETVELLAQILTKYNLNEIEYEKDNCKIYLSKQFSNDFSENNTSTVQLIEKDAIVTQHEVSGKSPPQEINWQTHSGVILSPMVGIVYMSPEPSAEPFIHIGSSVSVGQTLLIIEAMKVLNPIKAHKAGKVIAILVNDKKPVEYKEPLIVIE